MGRKNLLDGLMQPAPREGESPQTRPAPRAAAPGRGTVGAVNRSIADLRARAVVELDPHAIEADGPQDRLEHDPQEDAGLAASIREHGQQVPVLVRPHSERPDVWRIVYGRRRVLAAREIGVPVKALVRELDDEAAVLAQGQENTHRRDLSFIEKANFARQLRELGYDRKAISEAVNVDKTLLSRFLSVAERVPLDVIESIGAAPGIGRTRWMAFADHCERSGWAAQEMVMVAGAAGSGSSDARFEALFEALSGRSRRAGSRAPAERTRIRARDGAPIATVSRSGAALTLAFRGGDRSPDPFAEWLMAELPGLHDRWKRESDGSGSG